MSETFDQQLERLRRMANRDHTRPVAVADAAAIGALLERLRQRSAALLRRILEELSEDCWCAGWLHDWEYLAWAMVQGDYPARLSWCDLSAQMETLRELAGEAGGWWRWNPEAPDGGELVFVPQAEWEARYAAFEKPWRKTG